MTKWLELSLTGKRQQAEKTKYVGRKDPNINNLKSFIMQYASFTKSDTTIYVGGASKSRCSAL